MILTQQGSQAAFSLAQMGGKAAAVGRFLSSPWVAALAIAGTALGSLLTKSEDTADALEKIKFSSDAVGSAQGIMGDAMDLATGKITTQRKELIALAIAQSKVGAIQAQTRANALRGEVQSLQAPTTELSGGFPLPRRPRVDRKRQDRSFPRPKRQRFRVLSGPSRPAPPSGLD
ncbi:hypothetical protein [Sphingobium sp. Ndbn-10]|uniref:hypothetical protein n=1 Tax=Sphingobium sp. Ndbn-10 TaxID=1667223 RepID=UPI00201DD06C|nr:hypothetical protein [Sphingobium sp. Ndbn-10]